MKKIFKFELVRAFDNKLFWISLGIGILFVLLHVVTTVIPQSKYLNSYLEDSSLYPHSVFEKTIGLDAATPFTMLYYLALPIVAALPYAASFAQDLRSGYARQLVTRCSKAHYLAAKSMVLFISVATITGVPIIADYYLTSLFMPALVPQASTRFFPISDGAFMSHIYYTQPLIYWVVYCLIVSIFMGVFCQISLLISRIFTTNIEITLIPFVIYLLLYFTSATLGMSKLAPIAWILPFQPAQSIEVVLYMGLFLGIMLLFLVVLYYIRGKKEDVF